MVRNLKKKSGQLLPNDRRRRIGTGYQMGSGALTIKLTHCLPRRY